MQKSDSVVRRMSMELRMFWTLSRELRTARRQNASPARIKLIVDEMEVLQQNSDWKGLREAINRRVNKSATRRLASWMVVCGLLV